MYSQRLPNRIVLVATIPLAVATTSSWAVLPTDSRVTLGAGQISKAGDSMIIQQSSENLAIDWQNFSIGKNNSVQFRQPNSDAIALNRVLGSDVSVVQGALTANGRVFLINPNGVTFTPDAKVNVGGLLASTHNISSESFLSGDFVFEGNSAHSITNQGSIKTTSGGSVALIAAKIVNTGEINAPNGHVLFGAGSKVALDLGGPVSIEVEQGALNSLIEQGGAIRADSGQVYLTAKAADDLTTSTINHSGVTEAISLGLGGQGEIILLGDMDNGVAHISGSLNAGAPHGGDGGFIETSAATVKVAEGAVVSTKSEHGKNGVWLIDPNDYTIAESGGDITGATLSSNLVGGNVVIQTTGAGGNLYVNDEVSWSDNELTLQAHHNILVNADMTATEDASLAFEYGRDSTDGAGSGYEIAGGLKLLIPDASAFTWKKGTDGPVNNLWFGNNYLAFGEDQPAALNENGALLQPFYNDEGTTGRNAGWYKLTYSDYPLDFAVGTGGDGTDSWNINGEILNTDDDTDFSVDIASEINYLSIDIAAYKEGIGTLVSTVNVDVAETSDTANVVNAYNLGADDSYIRTVTTVENGSSSSALSNVRLWVGTRDDYVATSDSNYKEKGNLGEGFEPITDADQRAKAIKVREKTDGTGAAILFYSISDGADTVTDDCCDFENVIEKNPRDSEILTEREDGSYALFLRMSDLAAGESERLVWYYAAGQAENIETIIEEVAEAALIPPPIDTNPPPEPEPPVAALVTRPTPVEIDTTIPEISAITMAQTTSAVPARTNVAVNTVDSGSASGGDHFSAVGTMDIIEVSSSEFDGLTHDNADDSSEGAQTATQSTIDNDDNVAGLTKVVVVDGGIDVSTATRR